MGLFDRLSRVVRANLNDIVSKAEDPEKVLEQAIIDMQEDLVQLRQAVARAIATQKRTEQQYNKNQSEANSWQSRAQLALQKGDENLAREALVRKKTNADTAATLKAQLDQQVSQVDTLKRNLIALESKISEAKTKKDMLKSRAAAAKANEQLQSTISGLNTGGAMSAFERMEEKVLMMEAKSQAAGELAGSDLESQFAMLESGSDVDDELAARKELLTGDSVPRKPKSVPRRPKEVLIIEKAIRDTRNALGKATGKQTQIQNQQVQAKTKISSFHKEALQAVNTGHQASAIQALVGEAVQEKLVDVLKSQLEQQEAVVDLLKQNLAVLEEVKITVAGLTEADQDEVEESLTSPSSNSSAVDAELDALQKQIDNL